MVWFWARVMHTVWHYSTRAHKSRNRALVAFHW
jgi:hypothetical protein